MSQLQKFMQGSSNPIDTLTGNSGGPVPPTAGNVNIVGSGSITVTGNPGTSTLTISSSALTSISITGDTGGAQTGSAFTFTASGIGLSFAGASDIFTLGGTLDLANGGTSASLTASNGGIFYSTASAGAILAGTATAKQMLQSGASTTPAWSTSTWPATTTINQLLYSSANNVVGGVTAGDYGVLISSSSGVPSWLANGTTGQVLTATTSGTPSWANAAASSITITGNSGGGLTGNSFTFTGGSTGLTFAGAGSTETLGGDLVVANGGTGNTTFTAYSVITAGTTATGAFQNVVGVGTSGQVLTSQGASTLPHWASPASSSITITGDSGGGLTGTSFTFTGGTTGLTFAGSGTTETLGGTLAIANGGTDATSFTQSNGIVTYNGTRLVNYAGPQISSGGTQTNISQPAFFAYKSSGTTNATGDGTVVSVIFDTAVLNQGSNYNTGTGLFTAPVTGFYHFSVGYFLYNLSAAFTNFQLYSIGGGLDILRFSPGTAQTSGLLNGTASFEIYLSATSTVDVTLLVSGSTKTVAVNGNAGPYVTWFSGYLVC